MLHQGYLIWPFTLRLRCCMRGLLLHPWLQDLQWNQILVYLNNTFTSQTLTCSPRAPHHHQHWSNQLAHWRPRPNFSPSISSIFQPFPTQHCYLPNYLQQQAKSIWMPSFPLSSNTLMCQNSNSWIRIMLDDLECKLTLPG